VKSRSYESPTRKAHAEATQRKILQALIDLLVEEGAATISIPLVAKRAGVSVRTVYHYFPTKEALFDGLTGAMSTLVATPDGPPPTPTSPKELVEEMPLIFRYLDANRRLFRAINVSELGDRMAASRQPERQKRIDSALGPLVDQLEPEDLERLRAVVGVLTSFEAYDAFTDVWGLTQDEAADAAAWAVRVLCERARRTGATR
jgi:AcrR family transcriptional regulator